MAVFLVAQIQIVDRERYGQYEAGFMEIFGQYQGKVLSVDETPQVLEGEWPHTRTVLIEFPSQEDATAWYESEEYQALARHRQAASVSHIALLNGLPSLTTDANA